MRLSAAAGNACSVAGSATVATKRNVDIVDCCNININNFNCNYNYNYDCNYDCNGNYIAPANTDGNIVIDATINYNSIVVDDDDDDNDVNNVAVVSDESNSNICNNNDCLNEFAPKVSDKRE